MASKKRNKTEKKGAIELSIGTVVIIVLAMTMLVLGIVLVRNIFKTNSHRNSFSLKRIVVN